MLVGLCESNASAQVSNELTGCLDYRGSWRADFFVETDRFSDTG